MVFSSSIFLFFFLPCVLLIYYIPMRNRAARNLFLTVMSLLFYAWGEPWFVFVMLLSIACNWQAGILIDRHKADGHARRYLVGALVFDVGLLGAFKYLKFILNNLNLGFGLNLPVPDIMLPIGISFFTFQAISYVMDVYRGDGQAQKSFWDVCLYISFFPQLIAGPIVRYQTVADEIKGRVENMDDFCSGARRFMVGLSKKVILSNNLALLVEHAYSLGDGSLSVSAAWMAAIFYHVQVFFDFSGYSDMAIGLGRMFGFHFLENFDYPMLAKSITGFWRRWHISLGSWFRDYLFFPLGGSRVKSKWRLAFNMFVVWLLTGLWHGADWTFAVWGVSFFVLLLIEKLTGLGKWMEKHWLGYVYTNVAVVVFTVFMRAESLPSALRRMGALFGIGANGLWDSVSAMYVREYGLFMAAAVLFSLPFGAFLEKRLHIPPAVSQIARTVGLLAAFAVSITYVVMGSYNPFIYFNF